VADYTIVNLMELENRGSDAFGTSDVRLARSPLETKHLGLSRIQYAPGGRSPRGHRHREQEEVYLVIGGSGQVKLDDDMRDVKQWDVVRVAPATFRGFNAGPDGLDLIAIGSDRPEGGDGEHTGDDWWDNGA
jgi:mannose-6-phosphate isomerase-like protein (cupin superfamily)